MECMRDNLKMDKSMGLAGKYTLMVNITLDIGQGNSIMEKVNLWMKMEGIREVFGWTVSLQKDNHLILMKNISNYEYV